MNVAIKAESITYQYNIWDSGKE